METRQQLMWVAEEDGFCGFGFTEEGAIEMLGKLREAARALNALSPPPPAPKDDVVK